MTQSINRGQGTPKFGLDNLSAVIPVSIQLVQYRHHQLNYHDAWELRLGDNLLGVIERIPSFLLDRGDEPGENLEWVYQFGSYPHSGYAATQAEAIGRLFASWLVQLGIASSDIYHAEHLGPDYM